MHYVVSCHQKRACCSYRALCLAQVRPLETHSAFLPVIAVGDGDASIALSTVSCCSKNLYFSRSGSCSAVSRSSEKDFYSFSRKWDAPGSRKSEYCIPLSDKLGVFHYESCCMLRLSLSFKADSFWQPVIYSVNMQATATWQSGQSGAPASSPASTAGASRQQGASLDPGHSSFSLLRTRRAAPDKRWKRGLAQVAWPQHCCLQFKRLFWFCGKVKTNWCWYCRRDVLWLPVENQPLARQRTHGVVSALRWNKCHRYTHKLPCKGMSEKSPFRFFFFCISCAEGSWTSFPTPPEFQFRFVCRKDRWELASLAVRSTSHVLLHESIWASYPYCGIGHGKKWVYVY